MFVASVHPEFRIDGKKVSVGDLTEIAYSFIKEGEEYQKSIGDFLLNWIDGSERLNVQTSGSTGVPKVITLLKEHMVNSALATGAYFKIKQGDTALLCLPCDYIAGKMMLVRAMVLGLNIYMVPPGSDPLGKLDKTFDFCAMIPLQVEKSINKLSAIKTLIVGGAAVSQELIKRLDNINTGVFETYGMTETITHIAVRRLNRYKEDNVNEFFQALPEICLSQDKRGCLVIRAPKVSKETIVTNDVVDLISDTQFRWLGRYDNVINSGGVKLHPETIEKKLGLYIQKPFFVTGVPDAVLGQKLVLIIEGEATHNYDFSSMKELGKYERPKEVYSLRRFAKTKNGKVQRKNCLQMVLDKP
ncbi:AMP-binding protein [Maribacter sp. MMG018]|uniref:AMP-binding protein n=1 Tax=Maribacter sp. MMG018 TaxID=2822688 RepID=UPI001B364969|nr:AMP-binding protein [Maribacter sp. MMG018]MBQ4915549.1 AMP-binding protein [Maribacter sp. MMG018]